MKSLYQTMAVLLFFCALTACSKNYKVYMAYEFPSYNKINFKNQATKPIRLFNQSIYSMCIYKVRDTFDTDIRQKFVNRRTISKEELKNGALLEGEIQKSSLSNAEQMKQLLVQTISVVFLDDERVLYYTTLQNNPENTYEDAPNTATEPNNISLTDNPGRKKDITLEEKDLVWLKKKKYPKRHYFHGVYRWTSDNTMVIEFQKSYHQLKKKYRYDENKIKEQFVKFYCAVDSNRENIFVTDISYQEADILAGNKEVKLDVNKVFGSKFNVAFSALNINKSTDKLELVNELGYIFYNKKVVYKDSKSKDFVEIKDIDKFNKSNPDKINKSIFDDYTVTKCVVNYDFKDTTSKSTIEYTFKNKVTKTISFQFSPSFIRNIKSISTEKLTTTIEGNKLTGYFNIYDKLNPLNKTDFQTFISKITTFDSYRERKYNGDKVFIFLENIYLTLTINDTRSREIIREEQGYSKLAITYRLIHKLDKKEYEFKVDSIALDDLNTTKKYYINDKFAYTRDLKDTCLSYRKMPKFNLFRMRQKRKIIYNKIPFIGDSIMAKFPTDFKIDSKGYYIEERLKENNTDLKTLSW
jgi:hypothetical protein